MSYATMGKEGDKGKEEEDRKRECECMSTVLSSLSLCVGVRNVGRAIGRTLLYNREMPRPCGIP